jgi:hypothetical protein
MSLEIVRRNDGSIELRDLRTGRSEIVDIPAEMDFRGQQFEIPRFNVPSHKICMTA